MALIIEDGTGVTDADSFVTLADARTIAADYGLTLDAVDATAEVQLRQAYLALNSHEPKLQGNKTTTTQESIFPREKVYVGTVLVDSNTIPTKVIRAQVYQADSIANGNTNNAIDTGEILASCRVEGVYSESYQSDSKTRTNAIVQGVANSLYDYTKAAYNATQGGGGLYREDMGMGWL